MKLKETFKYLFMAVALTAGFASCGDDDNDDDAPVIDPVETAAQRAAGEYAGWSKGDCNFFSNYLGDDATSSVTIAANTDGTATLTFTSATWGNLTLSNVAVTQSETGYSITGSGKYSMSGMSGSSSEYDCTMTGTISSDKQTYTITIAVPSVMGGLTITFQNGEPMVAMLIDGSSFEGYSLGNAAFFSNMLGQDESFSVEGNDDGTVNVAYNSSTWGEATFSNLTAAKDGDNYVISGSSKFSMGHAGSTKEYDCEVSATISSDKSTGTLTVSLPSVMGGLTINFVTGEPAAAIVLAGSYSGTSTMVMSYMPAGVDYTGQTTTITANEDGTINIAYSFTTTDEETNTTTEVGSIALNNVAVTENDDNYTFSVSDATFSMGMSGTLSEYTCNVEGTISKDKETYSIVYTIPAVMGGTTVTFHNVTAE